MRMGTKGEGGEAAVLDWVVGRKPVTRQQRHFNIYVLILLWLSLRDL